MSLLLFCFKAIGRAEKVAERIKIELANSPMLLVSATE